MANKIPGKGTLLKAEFTPGSNTFTTISQRVTIDGPTYETRIQEVTDLDSSAAIYLPTIADFGEVSGQIYFDPDESTHTSMIGLIEADPLIAIDWQVVFTDATPSTYEFTGILTSFEIGGAEVEGFLVADYTIKVSGGITRS